MQECILTVYCLAFNHEKYIRKTLEGFVNQKTSYKFHVVVHDDASTDGTKKIIEEYVQRYPELITPIYQTENQHSKKVDIYDNFLQPLMTSKYSAICEGDDYWCDPNKLQLQIDYMEQHPSCSLCVHNTELIKENGESKGIFLNETGVYKQITPEQVIEAGGGGLFHTSSFVYRTAFRHQKPKEFSIHGVGDYPLAMYLSMQGDVHYIGRVMSVYRIGSVNSWVKRVSNNPTLFDEHTRVEIEDLKRWDSMTEHKYHDSFVKAQKRSLYRSHLKKGNLRAIFRDPTMMEFFNENNFKQKCKTLVKAILKR